MKHGLGITYDVALGHDPHGNLVVFTKRVDETNAAAAIRRKKAMLKLTRTWAAHHRSLSEETAVLQAMGYGAATAADVAVFLTWSVQRVRDVLSRLVVKHRITKHRSTRGYVYAILPVGEKPDARG